MPITQSRMLDLLVEHERHIEAHAQLVGNINRALASALTPHDKCEVIRAELDAYRDMPDKCAYAERRHFNSQAKRNDRMRVKAERIRRARGIPERGALTHYGTSGYDAERDYADFNAGRGIYATRGPHNAPSTQHDATPHNDTTQIDCQEQSAPAPCDVQSPRDDALARAGASIGIAFDTPDDDSDIVDMARDL